MSSPTTPRRAPAAAAKGSRPARRGAVGARLPRAAQPQRAEQEGRQPAQRPRPHREHLRPHRVRRHRPGRPAWPFPLVRPLHPAQARHRRRPHGHARAGGAGRRVLHAPRPHRRRRGHHRAARGPRRGVADLRARHRRHHRPAEHPVPLDPRRGHARGLGEARGRGPDHDGGLRRQPAGHPRLAGRRHRARRGHRRHAGHRGDQAALHRRPGLRQPAAQVQDRRLGPAGRGARGARHRVRRRRPPRARARLRPVGRRRPVDEPDDRPAARHLGAARRGPRRVGGRDQHLPRLRLPPPAAPRAHQVPGQGLGRREVPRGAGDRVPQASAARRAGARRAGPAARPRRRARAAGRQLLRRRRADRRPGVRLHAGGRREGGGAGRLAPGAVHPAAEAGRPRRARSPKWTACARS